MKWRMSLQGKIFHPDQYAKYTEKLFVKKEKKKLGIIFFGFV